MMKKNLINPLKALALFAVVFGLVFITSCGDDDDPEPTESIMEIIRNTEGLDSLEKYVEIYPDLVATLEAEGDFTFFAPNNTAFIGLIENTGVSDLTTINPLIIKDVLAYHLVSTRYESGDLVPGAELVTENAGKEVITVDQNGDLFTGSSTPDIAIITADIEATNGVVHTTGSVLIPVELGGNLVPLLPTTAAPILLGAEFTVLAQAIEAADTYAETEELPTIISLLTGTTTHTVFAPTNATFEAAADASAAGNGDGETTETELQTYLSGISNQQFYGILLNHIVFDEITPEDLTSTEAQTPPGVTYNSALQVAPEVYNELKFFYNAENAVNGIGVFIDSNGDYDFQGNGAFDGEVALPDADVRNNGRIHVIAGVLAPPQQ